MSFEIRPFRDEDLDQVVAIEKECFPDPYPRSLFRQLKSVVGDQFIVADDGRILGYAISEVSGGIGHIISMAVSAEHRRAGVGESLLVRLLRQLERSVDRVYLEVREGNSAAIGLYDKLSFKRAGLRDRYYPDGETAVVMVKQVGSNRD